jgi:hypothetical protein
MNTHIRLLLLLPLLLLGLAVRADVLVVTSANSALSHLSVDQVRQLFTGKLHEMDGQKLVPLDLPEDNKARTEFYKVLTGRDARQMRAYWTQLIFTGRGMPPKAINESELLRRLQSDTTSVGYLPAGANTSGLKVLAKLD